MDANTVLSSLRRVVGHTRRFLIDRAAIARWHRSKHATLILRYHSVGEPEQVAGYISPGISLPPKRFDDQVRFLVSRYDVIDLDEALDRSDAGRPEGSRPGVVITFDDGYQDNYVHALPALVRHGASATVYVVSGCVRPAPPVWTARLQRLLQAPTNPAGPPPVPVDIEFSSPRSVADSLGRLIRWLRGLSCEERERALQSLTSWLGSNGRGSESVMMDASQLKSMAERGVAIGAHTYSHPLLTAIPADEAESEIKRSREDLEVLLGAPVLHFSYPNPGGGLHENAAVREMVGRAGFRTASVSRTGLMEPTSNPLAIRRYGVNAGLSERLLFRTLGERQ